MAGLNIGAYNPYMAYAGTSTGYSAGNSTAGTTAGATQDSGVGKAVGNPSESTTVAPGKKSSPAECQTCKERKYQDGSDEMVSFKSAAHIAPEAAASAVRAHEQEHVTNAFNKATMSEGKVLSASVAIHTAVCPECGRTYVSGGTTTTKISYPNESNPYQQNRKSADAASLTGNNLDLAV